MKSKIEIFDEIFDSLLPELKEDIKRLDFRLRTITAEAQTFGVSGDLLVERLRHRFWGLVEEITSQQKVSK